MYCNYVLRRKYVENIHKTMDRQQIINKYITLDGHRKLNITPTKFLSHKNCDILSLCEAEHVKMALYKSSNLPCYI